jgi:hypothetical protein
VSYDLAVWEGEPPADDAAGLAELLDQQERYHHADTRIPPGQKIREYVDALLKVYPDLTPGAGDDDPSPWSTAPLIGEANGPYIYFPMAWSRCAEVSAVAARIARDQGLICYDPQARCLRPTSDELAG